LNSSHKSRNNEDFTEKNFSKNHERELDLVKEHLKRLDMTTEQKFKEISKIAINFNEINLKNMTENKKEMLWKNFTIKLPENGIV